MENKKQSKKTPHPEETGKVPASGVISETYKEEVNPQDELGSPSHDPQDPEESNNSGEKDLDSYPLEGPDESAEKDSEKDNQEDNNDDQDMDSPRSRDDEFLK
jgi:hypothetical protein